MTTTDRLLTQAIELLADEHGAPRITVWRRADGTWRATAYVDGYWRGTSYLGGTRLFGNGATPTAAIAYLTDVLNTRKATSHE